MGEPVSTFTGQREQQELKGWMSQVKVVRLPVIRTERSASTSRASTSTPPTATMSWSFGGCGSSVLFISSSEFSVVPPTLHPTGITPVIPPKNNRKTQRACDFALYCERDLVDRFFNQLKRFRAIATRYDKRARTFLAGVQLAPITILLN